MPPSISSSSEIQKGFTRKLALAKSKVRTLDTPPSPTVLYSHLSSQIDFTGISAPYEAPENPELHIKTNDSEVKDCVRIITDYLADKAFI
jgi:hypothetical protein